MFGFLTTEEGLGEMTTYADGIGPWKPFINSSRALVVNLDGAAGDANGDGAVDERDRALLPPSGLVERAHAHALLSSRLDFPQPAAPAYERLQGTPIHEYLHFYTLGVDGVFSDFPTTAFAARELFWLENSQWSEPDQ